MEARWMIRCSSSARSLSVLRIAAASVRLPARFPAVIRTMAASSLGRRSRTAYDGLLVDAGGTLLQLAKPVEDTYATIGKKYGLGVSEGEIKQGFRRAFAAPWPKNLRYQGDGREFWRLVVSEATGCARNDYFEEVYQHYANGEAWCLPVGTPEALCRLKDAGGHKGQLSWQLSLILIID